MFCSTKISSYIFVVNPIVKTASFTKLWVPVLRHRMKGSRCRQYIQFRWNRKEPSFGLNLLVNESAKFTVPSQYLQKSLLFQESQDLVNGLLYNLSMFDNTTTSSLHDDMNDHVTSQHNNICFLQFSLFSLRACMGGYLIDQSKNWLDLFAVRSINCKFT